MRKESPNMNPWSNAHCHNAYMLMAVISISCQACFPCSPRSHLFRASLISFSKNLDMKPRMAFLNPTACLRNYVPPFSPLPLHLMASGTSKILVRAYGIPDPRVEKDELAKRLAYRDGPLSAKAHLIVAIGFNSLLPCPHRLYHSLCWTGWPLTRPTGAMAKR